MSKTGKLHKNLMVAAGRLRDCFRPTATTAETEPDTMLSEDEIRGMKNICPEAASEAYAQASARLQDLLQASSTFDQRASTLCGLYVTIALALITGAGTIEQAYGWSGLAIGLGCSGAFFTCGAVFLMLALRQREYGYLGSDPSVWLHDDVLAGDKSDVAYVLAYLARDFAGRIAITRKSNVEKMQLIEAGIWFGVASPIILVAFALPHHLG